MKRARTPNPAPTPASRLALGLLVLGQLVACSGGGDGGGAGGDEKGGTDDDVAPVVPPAPPTLEAASAHQYGRYGHDLLIRVQGNDPNDDVAELHVRVLGASGVEVSYFDLDWNGAPDAAAAVLKPRITQGDAHAYVAEVVLENAMIASGIAKLEVSAVDASGRASASAQAVVELHDVRTLGQACDPAYVLDRCAEGLGCRGEPTVCVEGVAPVITRAAYLRFGTTAHVLVEGDEPDDDLAALHIEFQTLAGAPVIFDIDGDDIASETSFEAVTEDACASGRFFVAFETTAEFIAKVPQLVITPRDHGGRSGPAVVVKLASTPVRGANQSCSALGFDVCGNGYVCSPGDPALPNVCTNATTLRHAACQTPVTLAVGETLVVSGEAEGTSLWDSPEGCAVNDPTGRPDGAVAIHLDAPVTKLVVTSDRPRTSFDTVVYVLPGCPTSSSGALACADDGNFSFYSTLTLENLPKGDYLVVVDSWSDAGGSFELAITAE